MFKQFRFVTLQVALIVPYVALVIILAVTIGLLSYLAGSRAVHVVSEHLLHETVGRIGQAVERHVVGSGATLEAAFPNGMPAKSDIETDFDELRNRFWIATSLHIDPNNYVYYGNRSGQAIGLYRHSLNDGELRVKFKHQDYRSLYSFSGINGELNFKGKEAKFFDPRERPWYKAGETAKADLWTSVYIDFRTLELVATRARRVMAPDGALEGVVATDVPLKALNDFVRSISISPNGLAFIIEASGDLIASSVSNNVEKLADGTSKRVSAAASGHPMLTAVNAKVSAILASQAKPVFPQIFNFETEDGTSVHAAFDRVRDTAGLDWITVVALPSSDFMGNVRENVYWTLFVALMAVLLAVGLGLRIIHWVTDDLNDLSIVARNVGDGIFAEPKAIDRRDEIGDLARTISTMQHHLQTDRLTEIANRESFMRALTRSIKELQAGVISKTFAVLFIDLNHFKQINDTHGHDAGDRVLVEAANRLRHQVRSGDMVARYAGDEFVILLHDIADKNVLESVRTFVETSLSRPWIDRRGDAATAAPIMIAGSVGMALYPEDGADADALVKAADVDMYHRKTAMRASEPGAAPDR